MAVNRTTEHFWKIFREKTGHRGTAYNSYAFGDSPELADELLALILGGIKKATADLVIFYEKESLSIPKPEDYSIILNSTGNAKAIIRTTKVLINPFHKIGEDFARAEGEGDMTLGWWRQVHRAYFERQLKNYNLGFQEDMKIVCQYFEKVWPVSEGGKFLVSLIISE